MNALLIRVVAAATAVSAALVLFTPRPIAAAGGLLLGFVLPGAALTEALFPRRVLTRIERILLAPALSLAMLVVGGLLLYVCRAPLNRVSWTAFLAGVTVLALVVPLLPRRRSSTAPADPGVSAPEPASAAPVVSAAPASAAHTVVMQVVPVETAEQVAADRAAGRTRLIRQLLPLVLVVAILGGAGWLSLGTSLATDNTSAVTALSASPPAPADADGNRTVVVKATGLRTADAPYRVIVSSVTGTTARSRTVSPDADGEWTETVTIPADRRVTIGLYRADDDTVYRTISIAAEL